MSSTLSRRRFLTHSLAASAAAPAVMSIEERHLLARSPQPVESAQPVRLSSRWVGQIGKVKISRLKRLSIGTPPVPSYVDLAVSLSYSRG